MAGKLGMHPGLTTTGFIASGALPKTGEAVTLDPADTTGTGYILATLPTQVVAGVAQDEPSALGEAFSFSIIHFGRVDMFAEAVAVANGDPLTVKAGGIVGAPAAGNFVLGQAQGVTTGVLGEPISVLLTFGPYRSA